MFETVTNAPMTAAGDVPTPEAVRDELIRLTAYYRAEQRGFAGGHELEDWLEAEREVDHWIATRGAPSRYACPR